MNKHKHGKPDFNRKSESFAEFMRADKAMIKDISLANKGESFIITATIDKVMQTGGPTVFYVSDGTGTLAIKAFEKAGVRAFPEVDVSDAITTTVTIGEFNDGLEGEVQRLTKLTGEEKKRFEQDLIELERKRAKVEPIPFLVHSPILEKLKERFIKAATEIRLAIFQNRPIVIRHHNDTDGYSSGYALERAILPLIEAQHSSSVKAAWEFYTRSPCNAPMYEIEDSIRDTVHSLSNAAKFSNKMPLVLIVDTGSGKEDLLGVQQGRIHGLDFIVVDHHQFEEDLISAETLVHINPFLVGENGAHFSAGMLCTELARFINPVENVVFIPALAGLADRIDNPPVMKEYLKHAEAKGYSQELLADIATVIDFVSSKLRFMEAREYIEVLFGEPMDKQKKLVHLLAPHIRELDKKGLAITSAAAHHEEVKGIHLQSVNIEATLPRGFYPKPGKCISSLHDHAQESKKITKLVTLGILSDAITMRATDGAQFSVPDLVVFLNKKLPDAFVEGGGHKNAGSIKFIPRHQDAVVEAIKEFIRSRN